MTWHAAVEWAGRLGLLGFGVILGRLFWHLGSALSAAEFSLTRYTAMTYAGPPDEAPSREEVAQAVREAVDDQVRAYREKLDQEAALQEERVAAGIAEAVQLRTELAMGRLVEVIVQGLADGVVEPDSVRELGRAALGQALLRDQAEHGPPHGGWSTRGEELTVCQIPPEGWKCTRPPGHEGPCAAIPAPFSGINCAEVGSRPWIPPGMMLVGDPEHVERALAGRLYDPERVMVVEEVRDESGALPQPDMSHFESPRKGWPL